MVTRFDGGILGGGAGGGRAHRGEAHSDREQKDKVCLHGGRRLLRASGEAAVS